MTSPAPMPTTSDSRLPKPAAAKVDMPRVTPIDLSIASPAKIMITLSANPNPTKGTPFANAKRQSCARLGGSTLALVFCCRAATAGGAVERERLAVRAARRHIVVASASRRQRARERCSNSALFCPFLQLTRSRFWLGFDSCVNVRVVAAKKRVSKLFWAVKTAKIARAPAS